MFARVAPTATSARSASSSRDRTSRRSHSGSGAQPPSVTATTGFGPVAMARFRPCEIPPGATRSGAHGRRSEDLRGVVARTAIDHDPLIRLPALSMHGIDQGCGAAGLVTNGGDQRDFHTTRESGAPAGPSRGASSTRRRAEATRAETSSGRPRVSSTALAIPASSSAARTSTLGPQLEPFDPDPGGHDGHPARRCLDQLEPAAAAPSQGTHEDGRRVPHERQIGPVGDDLSAELGQTPHFGRGPATGDDAPHLR